MMKHEGYWISLWKMTPYFPPNSDFKFSIAITIAIKNRSQINQTLIYFFQPDLA
jgi:hypothetical protein